MAESTTTTAGITMEQLKSKMFTSSMSVLGATGLVIWAHKNKKKGKFWWGLGGLLAGGALGGVIDYFKNSK